jgi:protein involved in polysaccharide export with SLBB domain
MQFGNSGRFLKFGSIFLFAVLGANVSPAQDFSQFGQALGNTSTQSTCSPDDPTCQSTTQQQQSYPNRSTSAPTTQQGISSGAVLPGSSEDQNQNQNNNQNQLNEQYLNHLYRQPTPLPLDSPTEFQNLIANSLGKMLPIYGASLFRKLPTTFAPLNLVPVTPDYVIGPGDQLLIQIWGQVTLNSRFTVDRSGSIYIPQVGTIHVAGQPFSQLQSYLKTQISRVFRHFDLNVNMGELRSIQVFVVGQARRPGSFTISSLSTLTNALFASGGPSPQGSQRHIQLKRDGKVVVDFDLYDLLQRGDKTNDVQLLPGDIIFIPPVGPQIAVAGNVNTPAIYELKDKGDSTVGDALKLASGLTNVALGTKVRLERVYEHRMRSMMEVSLDEQGRSTVVQDGDLLEVNAIRDQYKDAITLRGNVANPGRYTWKPGMRVLDLIPDKDALITQDYWLKRSMLGQPMLAYIPTCLPRSPYGIPDLRYGISAGDEGEHPNWRYSSTHNTNLTGLSLGPTEAGSPSQDGVDNLDENGMPLTDGGLDCTKVVQTTQFGTNDRTQGNSQNGQNSQNGNNSGNDASANGAQGNNSNASSANRSSTASASIGSTVASSSAGNFLPRNEVKLGEPDIDWSYAVIERQSKENLTTSLLPFNLG